uniref:Chloride channel protein n=1 Tax=Panagrellus redivivus TaxID=6233 RepID=A0A7E4UQV7_PANRE
MHRTPGGTMSRASRAHVAAPKLLDHFEDPEFAPVEGNHHNRRSSWFANVVKRQWVQLSNFLLEDSLICVLMGVIVAAFSFSVDISYEHLHWIRRNGFEAAAKRDWRMGLAFWVSFMTCLVAGAAVICKYISREAIGSGIPNIRVILDGFMLSNYFTLRTLFAKVTGLVLTLGSGLPIGKEGPFIHIGAIVAMALSRAAEKLRGNSFMSSQGREMQNVLAGAAAGIACTFNAPVGAVLYAIESTSRFSAVKNLWRSFLTTTCAALAFHYANVCLAPENVADTILSYYETHLPNKVYVVKEIPLFVLVGLLSGLAGSFFVFVYRYICLFRKHNKIYRKIFGTTFDVSFTVFMAVMIAFVTYPGKQGIGQYIGGKWTLREQLSDFISNCTMIGLSESHQCPDDIVYRWATHGSPFYALTGFLVVNFILVAISISLAVPASIFVPSFVIGACGGRIIGEIVHLMFPDGIGEQPIYPGLYAIVGAAAFTGAVTHSISIAVIVCEATGQLSSLLPVLIALLTATTVAGFLQPSIYDAMVRLKKYPHLNELPPNRAIVHELLVEQFMTSEVGFVSLDSSYLEVRQLLISRPELRAIALVNNNEDMILLGSVSRKYLHYLLLHRVGPDPGLLRAHFATAENPQQTLNRKRSSTGNLLANVILTDRSLSGNTLLSTSPLHQDFREADSPLAPLLRRQKTFADELHHEKSHPQDPSVPPVAKSKITDVIQLDDEAIEPTPCQLVRGTSLSKVHNLFTLLGLQHAYVTDRGRLVGVVSINELREVVSDIYVANAALKYVEARTQAA